MAQYKYENTDYLKRKNTNDFFADVQRSIFEKNKLSTPITYKPSQEKTVGGNTYYDKTNKEVNQYGRDIYYTVASGSRDKSTLSDTDKGSMYKYMLDTDRAKINDFSINARSKYGLDTYLTNKNKSSEEKLVDTLSNNTKKTNNNKDKGFWGNVGDFITKPFRDYFRDYADWVKNSAPKDKEGNVIDRETSYQYWRDKGDYAEAAKAAQYSGNIITSQSEADKLRQAKGSNVKGVISYGEVGEGIGKDFQYISNPGKGKDVFDANFKVGDLGVKYQTAMYQYMNTDNEAYYNQAKQYQQELEDFLKTNKNVGQGGLLLKDFSEYLAQPADKFTRYGDEMVKGAIVGGGTGATMGGAAGSTALGVGAVPGAIAGGVKGTIGGLSAAYTVATTKHSYELMAGAAYGELLDMGVPKDIAKRIARDTGIVNSLIETGETVLSLASAGLGKLGVQLGKKAATETVQEVAEEVTKKNVRGILANAAKAYGLNILSEGAEEGSQEIVSIIGENIAYNMAKDRNPNAKLKQPDSLFSQNSLNRIAENAIGGAKVAIVAGSPNLIGRATVETIDYSNYSKAINNVKTIVDKQINKVDTVMNNDEAFRSSILDNSGMEALDVIEDNLQKQKAKYVDEQSYFDEKLSEVEFMREAYTQKKAEVEENIVSTTEQIMGKLDNVLNNENDYIDSILNNSLFDAIDMFDYYIESVYNAMPERKEYFDSIKEKINTAREEATKFKEEYIGEINTAINPEKQNEVNNTTTETNVVENVTPQEQQQNVTENQSDIEVLDEQNNAFTTNNTIDTQPMPQQTITGSQEISENIAPEIAENNTVSVENNTNDIVDNKNEVVDNKNNVIDNKNNVIDNNENVNTTTENSIEYGKNGIEVFNEIVDVYKNAGIDLTNDTKFINDFNEIYNAGLNNTKTLADVSSSMDIDFYNTAEDIYTAGVRDRNNIITTNNTPQLVESTPAVENNITTKEETDVANEEAKQDVNETKQEQEETVSETKQKPTKKVTPKKYKAKEIKTKKEFSTALLEVNNGKIDNEQADLLTTLVENMAKYKGVSFEEFVGNTFESIDSSTDETLGELFKKISTSQKDKMYMEAVENGNIEMAKAMVEQAAKENGFDNAIPEQTLAYKIRTGKAPKKTIKVYKTFTVAEDGSPTALFISGKESLPQNVWLDAQDTWHFKADNGKYYVPSTQNPYSKGGKTGASVTIPNDTIRKELLKRGFITKPNAEKVTALAYRPGWHAGDMPFFPQGGKQGNPELTSKGKPNKRYDNTKATTNYENIHRYNQVVFECEMSIDKDYTQYSTIKSGENKGKVAFKDMQEMPVDGSYKYSTNPLATSGDIGSWYISGSLKIVRPLTEQECNDILSNNGFAPQEWQQYQDNDIYSKLSDTEKKAYEGKVGELDLSKLGIDGEKFDAARKTLAPITYDDKGKVIPLSERFDSDSKDVRFKKVGDTIKASVAFGADGKAVLRAFENSDVASMAHEIAHVFRRTLNDTDMKVAEDFCEVVNGEWTERNEEIFAEGFEKYLTEGRKFKNPAMQTIYDKFKAWLTDIYTTFRTVFSKELNDDIRKVYDKLLGVNDDTIVNEEITFQREEETDRVIDSATNKEVDRLIKEYDIVSGKDKVREIIKKLFDEICYGNFAEGIEVFIDEFGKLDVKFDDGNKDFIKELRGEIKRTKLYLSPEIQTSSPDFNKEILRKKFGLFSFTKDKKARHIDTLYQELNSFYPDIFTDDIFNEVDQFYKILDVLDEYEDGTYKLGSTFGNSKREALEFEASKLFDNLSNEFELAKQQENEVADVKENAINKIISNIKEGKKMTSKELYAIADEYYGGKQSENAYVSKDAYELLEVAVNKYLLEKYEGNTNIKEIIADLENNIMKNIPTQTNRDSTQVKLQQFSTPPTIASVMAWVADINNNDTVLEPSAGNGGIAIWAKNKGATTYVNEIDERRIKNLERLGFDGIFTENAELLNNTLPDNIQPDVVVMNPPFSTALQTDKKDSMNVTKHIEQALLRVKDGGRVVILAGNTLMDNSAKFSKWWKGIKSKYNVRANVNLSGKTYYKYGTTYDVQMIVIDKTGATTDKVLTGHANTVSELIDMLKGVQNERQERTNEQVQGVQEDTRNAKDVQNDTRTEQVGDKSSNKQDGKETKQDLANTESRTDNDSSNVGSNGELATRDSDTRRTDKDSTGDNRQTDIDTRPGEVVESDIRETNVNDKSNKQTTDTKLQDDTRVEGNVDRGNVEDNARGSAINQEYAKISNKKVEKKSNRSELSDDDIFSTYTPAKMDVENVHKHPSKLVESAAMSAVEPPDITYTPKLSKKQIEKGLLSDAQIEAITYAGQAHSNILPDGTRQAHLIGDGTGVGKGREIAGIIYDNFQNGRKKAVWITQKQDLFKDAVRDLQSIGWEDVNAIKPPTNFRDKVTDNEGIYITTYSTLSSDLKSTVTFDKDKNIIFSGDSRLKQLVDWLGKDFDGVIVFDEAHAMKGAIDVKGSRGVTKATQAGLMGTYLDKLFPNARIEYVSATSAVNVEDLSYAGHRLGLWGEGTPFPNAQSFMEKINKGGISAMEVLTRDLKAFGKYISRSISFEGVEVERLEHKLSNQQGTMYDKLTDAWQIVLENFDKALELTDANGNAKKNAKGAFWGANQRFFNQIGISLSLPSVIADMKKQLADGNCCVLQMTSTYEAQTEKSRERAAALGLSDDDVDLTPRQTLLSLVERAFPTIQYTEIEDDAGNRMKVPAVDSNGKVIENKEALAMKQQLLADLDNLPIPDDAMSLLYEEFGEENIAEVTGRKTIAVKEVNKKTGLLERVFKKLPNSKDARNARIQDFNDGKKNILIFSNAGGTGSSFHANKDFKNQKRRVHYLLESGYNAMAALQGFGRTHRSNEVSQPIYKLVSTDIPGQKRFMSTIAKRLNQLGAMTKGQRDAQAGIFSEADDLENPYTRAALRELYYDIAMGKIDPDYKSVLKKLGMTSTLDEFGLINPASPDLTNTTKFLNRLLTVNLELQNKLFDAFDNRIRAAIEEAKLSNTYDTGTQVLKGLNVNISKNEVIYTDTNTNTDTNLVELKVTDKTKKVKYSDIDIDSKDFLGFYVNKNSGNIRAVYRGYSSTNAEGKTTERIKMYGVTLDKRSYSDMEVITKKDSVWVKIDSKEKAKAEWNKQLNEVPDTYDRYVNMLTGTLINIWDKLPEDNTKIYRTITDDGVELLGRVVSDADLKPTLQKLNVKLAQDKDTGKVTSTDIMNRVYGNNETAVTDQNWKIKRSRVNGENRIELTNGKFYFEAERFKKYGMFSEIIQNKERWFFPTNNTKVLDNFLKDYNIVTIIDSSNTDAMVNPNMAGTDVKLTKGAYEKTGLASDKDIMSSSELVTEFEKQYGIRIKKDTVRGKGVQGLYNKDSGNIKTKFANDIRTIAHEVSHHLDNKYGIRKLANMKKIGGGVKGGAKILAELKKAGQLVSGKKASEEYLIKEGIAEIYARLISDRDSLSEYPNATMYLQSLLDDKDAKLLDYFYEKIYKIQSLPDVEKVKNDISFDSKETVRKNGTPDAVITTIGDKIVQNIFNDSYVIEKLQKEIMDINGVDGMTIDEANDFYGQLKAAKSGAYGVSLHKIYHGQTDINGKVIGKSLKEILAPVMGKLTKENKEIRKDYSTYLTAKRFVVDYARRGKVTPQEYSTYKNVVTELEAKYPQFKKVSIDLQTFLKNELQYYADGGLLSPETIQAINDNNLFYVPLYRIMDNNDKSRGMKLSNDMTKNAGLVKAIKGGTENIIDPMESIIKNVLMFTKAAMNNKGLQTFRNELSKVEQNKQGQYGGIMYEVGVHIKPDTMNKIDLIKKLTSIGVLNEISPEYMEQVEAILDMTKTFSPSYKPNNANEILIYDNGKPTIYYIADKHVFNFLKGATNYSNNAFAKLIRSMNSMLRMGVVMDINFIVRNFTRDTMTTGIQSEVKTNMVDVFKGLISAIKKDKWYQDTLKSGGLNAYIYVNSRRDVQNVLNGMFDKSFVQSMLEFLYKPHIAFGNLAEIGELSTKIAEYRKSKEAGYNDTRAALNARKSTVDFSQGGEGNTIKFMRRYIPFSGAAMQGLYRFGQSFKAHPFRTATRTVLYVALPNLIARGMIEALDGDDEDKPYETAYYALNEYIRNNYICVPNPVNKGQFILIPLPFEFGFVGATMPNKLYDGMKGITNNGQKFLDALMSSFIPNLNFGVAESIYNTANNKNWYGSAIDNYGDLRLSPKNRYDDDTSTISIALGQLLGLTGAFGDWASPKRLDALANALGSSFFYGKIYRSPDIAKELFKYIGDTKDTEKNVVVDGLANALHKFYKDDFSSYPQQRLDFNDIYDDIKTMSNDYKFIGKEDKDLTKLLDGLKVYDSSLSRIDRVKKAINENGTLTKNELDKIKNDKNLSFRVYQIAKEIENPNLSEREKQVKIRELNKEMALLSNKGIEYYNKNNK